MVKKYREICSSQDSAEAEAEKSEEFQTPEKSRVTEKPEESQKVQTGEMSEEEVKEVVGSKKEAQGPKEEETVSSCMREHEGAFGSLFKRMFLRV